MVSTPARHEIRASTSEAAEEDLSALWRELAHETPDARAVMSNLVIFRERAEAEDVDVEASLRDGLVVEVARCHPSRVVLLVHDPKRSRVPDATSRRGRRPDVRTGRGAPRGRTDRRPFAGAGTIAAVDRAAAGAGRPPHLGVVDRGSLADAATGRPGDHGPAVRLRQPSMARCPRRHLDSRWTPGASACTRPGGSQLAPVGAAPAGCVARPCRRRARPGRP